jgi:hypothetical protein
MSDIQRWTDDLRGRMLNTDPHGEFVTYADHVEALRQAREGHLRDAEQYGYEQGQRDALAGAVQRVEALFQETHNWSSPASVGITNAYPTITAIEWVAMQMGIARAIPAIKGDFA